MVNYFFQFEYIESIYARHLFLELRDAVLEVFDGTMIPEIEFIDKPKGCNNMPKRTKTAKKKKEKKNATRKMTDKVKEGILKMLSEGGPMEEIMKRFDVSKSQIAALKAWKTMGKYS